MRPIRKEARKLALFSCEKFQKNYGTKLWRHNPQEYDDSAVVIG